MNIVDNLRYSPEDIRELAAEWPLCFHFKLPIGSRMVVAGAYKGKVIQLLADMYPGYDRIIGFEPQNWAVEHAEMRLKGYKNIEIVNFGIGVKSGVFQMGEWETDACSFVNTGVNARKHGEGVLVSAEDIFETYGFDKHPLELAVFNMEGYEFDLLPHLIDTGLIKNIRRLAVQLHFGFGNTDRWPETSCYLDSIMRRTIDNSPQWIYWENLIGDS